MLDIRTMIFYLRIMIFYPKSNPIYKTNSKPKKTQSKQKTPILTHSTGRHRPILIWYTSHKVMPKLMSTRFWSDPTSTFETGGPRDPAAKLLPRARPHGQSQEPTETPNDPLPACRPSGPEPASHSAPVAPPPPSPPAPASGTQLAATPPAARCEVNSSWDGALAFRVCVVRVQGLGFCVLGPSASFSTCPGQSGANSFSKIAWGIGNRILVRLSCLS